MAKEEPLYQDDNLKIDYHPTSVEDHLVYLKCKDGEELSYIIQRGILRDLALTKRGGIERKLFNSNESLLEAVKREGIGVDGLHVALCQAHAEHEERYQEWAGKQKR